MNYIIAILFGFIQGITEFLPVSSSGHLVILHKFFSLPITDELTFDVFLHFASFLAVVFFFRKDVLKLIIGFFSLFTKKRNKYGFISLLIILGTIPAAILGYLYEDKIATVLHQLEVVVVMLVLIGIVFIIAEKYTKKFDTIEDLNVKKALFIGFAQSLALIPGTSRSGITIIAGMIAGLKREEAIRFSFLLSIPVVFGAGITKVPHLFDTGLVAYEFNILLVAFISSLISSLLAIKLFLKIAKKYSLAVFAVYRFILAAFLIGYFFL